MRRDVSSRQWSRPRATLGDDAQGASAGPASNPLRLAQPAVRRAPHLQAEALAIYERLGDVRGQLECLYLIVQFSANTGDVDASRRYLALMSDRAASLSDQVVEAKALDVAATAALLRQEYRECFELTTRALALHLATNDREGEAASRGRLAVTAAWLADYDTALREFERALETYESIGNKRGLAVTHTNRTLLLMRLGLFERGTRVDRTVERPFRDRTRTAHDRRESSQREFRQASAGRPASREIISGVGAGGGERDRIPDLRSRGAGEPR